MKSKKILSLLLAGTMTAALLAVPAQAAEAPQPEPYTISADHWSREDFSQEASPRCSPARTAGSCTTPSGRPWWTAPARNPAYTMVARGDDYSAVKNLIGY